MISRSPIRATLLRFDNGSGSYNASSGHPRRCVQEGKFCGAAAEGTSAQRGNLSGGFAFRTFCLFATLICVPAILVASWFQFRVVGGFESELTTTEAQQIAAKLDAVLDARASALRMAAGSIEIENLNTSGGLNRLLEGIKGLFPDFRSLEIFNEQGQALAMMGELSLENVSKRAGLSKAPNQESGLAGEPAFRDTPSQDCFFLTLRHQGPDGAVWFSRARFSREAITAVLEPQRSNRNARLVSTQPRGPVAAKSSVGPREVAPAKEAHKPGWFNVSTRSFVATASLGTPDWTVTLERTVPLSMAYLFSLAMGGLLVVGSGILFSRSGKHEYGPGTIRVVPPSEAPELAAPQEEHYPAQTDEAVDRDPIGGELLDAPFAQEVSDGAAESESLDVSHEVEQSDEFASALAWSPWSAEADTAAAGGDAAAPSAELWDPFEGLEEELGLADETADNPYAPMAMDESEEVLVAPDLVASEEPAQLPAAESMAMLDTVADESVIAGDPILQDAIPDTLEVCWNEPFDEEDAPQTEQSSVAVVNRWYSGV